MRPFTTSINLHRCWNFSNRISAQFNFAKYFKWDWVSHRVYISCMRAYSSQIRYVAIKSTLSWNIHHFLFYGQRVLSTLSTIRKSAHIKTHPRTGTHIDTQSQIYTSSYTSSLSQLVTWRTLYGSAILMKIYIKYYENA